MNFKILNQGSPQTETYYLEGSLSVKKNAWDNWNGYLGVCKVKGFGLDEVAAHEWLNRQLNHRRIIDIKILIQGLSIEGQEEIVKYLKAMDRKRMMENLKKQGVDSPIHKETIIKNFGTEGAATCKGIQDYFSTGYNIKLSVGEAYALMKEWFTPKNELAICPKCGSGDVHFDNVSVRPYCGDCGHWAPVNHGSREGSISLWNEESKRNHEK